MNEYITIGEIIKFYRKEMGLSQEQLAQGICSREYIGKLENDTNIPTLDMVNQLSEKLHINLYDTYALMLRHHDIETHKKIELINQNMGLQDPDLFSSLIKEYETLPEFQSGEPAQVLLYAKACYTSGILNGKKLAISYAHEALSISSHFNINTASSKRFFSNIELTLLNLLAVEYCRIKNHEEGKKYFQLLENNISETFQRSHYATNRNNQFEIKLLAIVTYNHFTFFKDDKDFSIANIDKTLSLMNSLHCDYSLPELLLCKTYYQIKEKAHQEAYNSYQLAHYLGIYQYSLEYITSKEEEILGDYLEQLK